MWPNSQETADLNTFTEEFFNGKLHSFCVLKIDTLIVWPLFFGKIIWYVFALIVIVAF